MTCVDAELPDPARRRGAASSADAPAPAPPSPASRQIFGVSLPSKSADGPRRPPPTRRRRAAGMASAAAPAVFSIVRRDGLVLMNALLNEHGRGVSSGNGAPGRRTVSSRNGVCDGVRRSGPARPPCYHPRRQMAHRPCVVVLLAGLLCPRLGFAGTDAYGVRGPKSSVPGLYRNGPACGRPSLLRAPGGTAREPTNLLQGADGRAGHRPVSSARRRPPSCRRPRSRASGSIARRT